MSTRASAVIAGLCLVAGAHAEIKEFDADDNPSGAFHIAANWDPPGVPDAGDRIVILADKTCNIEEDAEADTMEIKLHGILRIKDGATLTLDNDDHIIHVCAPPGPTCVHSDKSIIDGELIIFGQSVGGDAVLEFVNATHEISGGGRIFGLGGADFAHIVIATDIKLVNKLATDDGGIRGAMTITGETGGTNRGILRNEGIVSTSAGLILVDDERLLIDAAIESTSDGVWVTDCTGVMQFNFGSTSLQGLFTDEFVEFGSPLEGLNGGIFKFFEDVRTCGTYRRVAEGQVNVDNAVFQYANFDGFCENQSQSPQTITPYICESGEFFEIDEELDDDIPQTECADC